MAKKATKEKSNGTKRPDCLCGCGEQAGEHKKAIFTQGHDMKLRGAFLRHARGEEKGRFTNAQIKWALGSHWMTAELKKELPKLRK